VTDIPPAKHQLEVSVFGPGIGECVVAHVGDGDWIVVDSCIERMTGRPIALEYLKSLQVNVESQVKLVVATHWHDDHIEGLAEILRAAKNAKFVNSAAYAFTDVMRVVALGNKTARQSSATKEYDGIVEVLKERRQVGERREAVGPIHALANKKLLALTNGGRSVSAEVFALSPSDGVFGLAQQELREALSAIQSRRRPVVQGPNQLSVVLWLKVGVLDVLLGGDLEHVSGTTEGWRAIINSSERPEGRAGFFKVSHHGSPNADCPECWTELLSEDPVAILTPYAPSKLPRASDIDRLCARTPLVYLTSDPTRYRSPRRENAVEKTMKEVTISRRALAGQMGHVRLRSDATSTTQEPLIDLRNGARRLCA
jgi:beta-lactamase superfamily II metal-dependent hydrolase